MEVSLLMNYKLEKFWNFITADLASNATLNEL